jgi:uncharacterized membrane protein YkvA (DUF1232 family)
MDEAEIGKILSPDRAPVTIEREERVRKGFWSTFRKAAKYIPFAEDVVAAYYCAIDPATPPRAKGILLAALAYFILPLDLVPDFIAAVGFTDDIAVLAAAISTIRAHMKPVHYEKARRALAEESAT